MAGNCNVGILHHCESINADLMSEANAEIKTKNVNIERKRVAKYLRIIIVYSIYNRTLNELSYFLLQNNLVLSTFRNYRTFNIVLIGFVVIDRIL